MTVVTSNLMQDSVEAPLMSTSQSPSEDTRANDQFRGIANKPTQIDLQHSENNANCEWPVSAEIRHTVIVCMTEIIKTSDDPKIQIAAARVLLSADSANKRVRAPRAASNTKGGKRTNFTTDNAACRPIPIYLPDNGRDG